MGLTIAKLIVLLTKMSIYILFFSAHVQKPSNAMYAIVLFNFKKRQKVKTKYLVPMGGAVPRPELAVSI